MRGTRTTLQYNRNHKQIVHNTSLKTAINTIKEKVKNEYPLIAEEIRLEYKTKKEENEINQKPIDKKLKKCYNLYAT